MEMFSNDNFVVTKLQKNSKIILTVNKTMKR